MFNVFKWFNKEKKDPNQLGKVSQTRRFFLKGAAMAGGALAAAGSIAGIRSKIKEDYQAAYDRDVLPGDKILQNNGFEEVSKAETEAMVQMFIDDYKHKRQA
jgi:hypothetical protein